MVDPTKLPKLAFSISDLKVYVLLMGELIRNPLAKEKSDVESALTAVNPAAKDNNNARIKINVET
jgi:hypothetical protein